MVDNCNSFHMVVSDDTCASIASSAGISQTDFADYNPGVGSGCSSLWLGYYVCIGIIGETASKTTVASTTTAGNGIATPTPTQAGMVDNCNSFHMVDSGDSCQTIATAAGIALADFYSWNSGVGSGCSSLWLGYYVCTGVVGSTPTPTAATTTTAGNGISTPTPTQAGMVGNCNSFHMVVSDDTCATIASEAGISTTDFYSWNSGVGSGCSSLWLGYYVCTGVIGSTPTTTKRLLLQPGMGLPLRPLLSLELLVTVTNSTKLLAGTAVRPLLMRRVLLWPSLKHGTLKWAAAALHCGWAITFVLESFSWIHMYREGTSTVKMSTQLHSEKKK
jgi:LysM repeat protein